MLMEDPSGGEEYARAFVRFVLVGLSSFSLCYAGRKTRGFSVFTLLVIFMILIPENYF